MSLAVIVPIRLQYYEPKLNEDEDRGPAVDTEQDILGNLAKNIGNKEWRKVSTHKVEVTKVLCATVLKDRHAIDFGDASASMVVNTTRKTIQAAEKVGGQPSATCD